MKIIKINGGKLLSGDVYIKGSKNASLGVIVAAILSKDRVIIQNVPLIQDIFDLLEILKILNVKVELISNVLIIDSSNIEYKSLNNTFVRKFRASYYFMGLMIALFKKCEILGPGGCNFESRPIDIHLDLFQKVGIKIDVSSNCLYSLDGNYMSDFEYTFRKKSVGASINALLVSSSLNKVTLNNISLEPEVMQVIEALILMGIRVELKEDTCTIYGRNKKNGFMISIIPDRIEAGTYALIGAAIGKEIRIKQIDIEHLSYLLELFNLLNVKYEYTKNSLTVYQSKDLRGVEIETNPYPGFPTDLQQPLTALLCLVSCNSVIKETIYTKRNSHIKELNKMNANIEVRDNCFYIEGNKHLVGNTLIGKDLRGCASLVLAALVAKGISYIEGSHYIERGYQNMIDNLRKLGADISVFEKI